MADSASVKVQRASEHIDELNKLLREQNPFSYILETDTQTGERAIYAKKNQTRVDRAATIAGDAIHNLRSALDHAYWAIVGPFAVGPRGEKGVQFPFAETAARLEEAVKTRLAHKVSQRFYDAIMALLPHGEAGGNRLLYLVHALDVPDKHRLLLPTAEYKQVDGPELRKQIPDFPVGIGAITLANNVRDFGWRTRSIDPSTLGTIKPPTMNIFEKELDVPVQILLAVGELNLFSPMVPTLNQFADVTKETIRIIREAA